MDLNIRWPNYPEIYIDVILLECFERNFLRVEGLFNTQEKNISTILCTKVLIRNSS